MIKQDNCINNDNNNNNNLITDFLRQYWTRSTDKKAYKYPFQTKAEVASPSRSTSSTSIKRRQYIEERENDLVYDNRGIREQQPLLLPKNMRRTNSGERRRINNNDNLEDSGGTGNMNTSDFIAREDNLTTSHPSSSAYRSVSTGGVDGDDHDDNLLVESSNHDDGVDGVYNDNNRNNFDDGDDHDSNNNEQIDPRRARKTLINFILMAVLFSANHGCVVSCLGLASARLGSVGAWQSGILYFTYTASALLGATYIVKRAGARNALIIGMMLYCAYVACFWIATLHSTDIDVQRFAAYTGAAIGGVGAGFLWTAQGAYFGQASEEHAKWLAQPVTTSTSSLAGIFAFCYLSEEVALRLLSSALLEWEIASWGAIFATYTVVAMVSTSLMPFLYNYPSSDSDEQTEENNSVHDTDTTNMLEGDDSPPGTTRSVLRPKSDVFYKVTAAAQLIFHDPKMKYMIGLNAAFGFTSAFLNSYVNGQVVPVALDDPDAKYIGILSSWVSAVAAGMSLLFGRVAPRVGKGPILILGAICFGCVALPFAIQPDATRYTWTLLVLIYTLHGTGRATFESTLKALFADYFPFEKEGAFANIIFQNGLSGAVGYILTFSLHCTTPSRYCVEYNDGSLHDVLTFALVVLISACFAMVGYLRASTMFAQEQRQATQQEADATILLERNSEGVSA